MIFDDEDQLIAHVENVLKDENHIKNPLYKEYAALFNGYKRLYKQFSRILKISDRQQIELKESREKISRCNYELMREIQERKRIEEELKLANAELERMASIDGLTQVANRRFFDEYIRIQWTSMFRKKSPLSLIMCDIDFFKKFNDTYGHAAGDECLKQVANALQRSVMRPIDLVARYGGEEFCVVLPDTDCNGAYFVAKRIHSEIGQLRLNHLQVKQPITISIGFSWKLPCKGSSPECLLAEADQALYQAKMQGRNRIIAYHDLQQTTYGIESCN